MNLDFTNVLHKVGQLVEDAAKQNLTDNDSVDSGRLRGSMMYEVTSPNEVEIGTNTEYGIYVEYGTGLFAENGDGRQDVPWHYQTADGKWHSTVGQKPKPFLRPALDDNEEEIKRMITEEAIKQMQEVIRNV